VFFLNAPYLMTGLMPARRTTGRLAGSHGAAGLRADGNGARLRLPALVADRPPLRRYVWCHVRDDRRQRLRHLPRALPALNSWDVVRVDGLMADVAGTILHPSANAHVIAYCAVLAAFLFTAYVVVTAWTSLREEARD
jgi:hypothetical protein